MTQEHYGVSGSYYQFIYNEAGDLQSVNFINELGASQIRFNFEYDGLVRISLVKDGNNSVLEFKELNSLIVHSLISRIEVGYRDNPRTIKIYYKFIDDKL